MALNNLLIFTTKFSGLDSDHPFFKTIKGHVHFQSLNHEDKAAVKDFFQQVLGDHHEMLPSLSAFIDQQPEPAKKRIDPKGEGVPPKPNFLNDPANLFLIRNGIEGKEQENIESTMHDRIGHAREIVNATIDFKAAGRTEQAQKKAQDNIQAEKGHMNQLLNEMEEIMEKMSVMLEDLRILSDDIKKNYDDFSKSKEGLTKAENLLNQIKTLSADNKLLSKLESAVERSRNEIITLANPYNSLLGTSLTREEILSGMKAGDL